MKKVYIFLPSFCPEGATELLKNRLKQRGFSAEVVQYSQPEEDESLFDRASKMYQMNGLFRHSTAVHAIGLSSGGVIAEYLLGLCKKDTFSTVQLVGCPMLGQSLFSPVRETFLHYLKKGHMFRAFWGKGQGFLTEEEAKDFLFGGLEHPLVGEIPKVGENWSVIWEMMTSSLRPTRDKWGTRRIVTTFSEEKFHRNSRSEAWAQKTFGTSYRELEGAHFAWAYDLVVVDALIDNIGE